MELKGEFYFISAYLNNCNLFTNCRIFSNYLFDFLNYIIKQKLNLILRFLFLKL